MRKYMISALILILILGLTSFTIAGEALKIGVIQIVEHPALDSARTGFIDALNDLGYREGEEVVYTIQNAQGDMSIAGTIAQLFVDEEMDLILAIATPTSQAMAQATEEIPILITAVTDPVAAGLVESMEVPGTNVTGTTDMTPVKTQLLLLKEIAPTVKRVGIVYNVGEVNSVVQVDIAKAAALELELEIIEASASSSGEVLQAAQSLVGRVDAIYVPTCNTAVSALESIVFVAEDHQLPLVVGEEDSVVRGGLATTGINYYDLGYQTGEMAKRVIEGEDPSIMAIQSADRVETVLNLVAAENMGVVFSEELLARAHRIIED